MRLLKTKPMSETGVFEIVEFDDISIPNYAILSHRWGNDELTLQDVERGTTAKEGFTKVEESCRIAQRDKIDYIWIDTICIDKTSSAELSEAINSMYLWYFRAHRCYAYLADVPSTPFGESQWFTRGWTLQELLAPADLVFLDANWKILGTKEGLQEEISNCTGIPVDILSGDEDIETCSIAQRMSWAAKRNTKRVEDLAYSLLGIFGINMPLLYGEGERAFIRLQEEIMRVSNDHSLFAWESHDNRGGLLATSPAAYKGSGNIVPLSHVDDSDSTLTISSRGVHLDFQLIGRGAQRLGLALLHCEERDGSNNQIAIYLRDNTGTMETFQRVRSQELKRLDLTKTGSSQYLTRRACVQKGRMIPTRRSKKLEEVDAIKIYEPYDGNVLEKLMNLAQPEALLHAAQEGRQDDAWLMLTRRDIDVDSKGQDGWPALFHAIKSGHGVIVKMLLARGADISLEDEGGNTPLILATKNCHEDIVELLLQRGADMTEYIYITDEFLRNISNNLTSIQERSHDLFFHEITNSWSEEDNHEIPLFALAALHQQENIVKLLLDKSTDVDLKTNWGPIALRWAARGGYQDIAGWLVDRGVEVNSNDRTPLSWAAEYSNKDTVEFWLKKGANIEAKDNEGRTPLSWASAGWSATDKINLLLDKGANIEAKDNEGRTPLLWASTERNATDNINLLLDKGANIEAKDNEGRTPLLWASTERNATDNINLLLDKGANIEAKDNKGRTALSWASTGWNATDKINLLLNKGANIEAKDNEGRTPLSWASARWNAIDNTNLLLNKGANIEAKDNKGRTPLTWAAEGSYEGTVKLLLENGANIEAIDNDGRAPLSWAEIRPRRQDKIIKLLLQKGARMESKYYNS